MEKLLENFQVLHNGQETEESMLELQKKVNEIVDIEKAEDVTIDTVLLKLLELPLAASVKIEDVKWQRAQQQSFILTFNIPVKAVVSENKTFELVFAQFTFQDFNVPEYGIENKIVCLIELHFATFTREAEGTFSVAGFQEVSLILEDKPLEAATLTKDGVLDLTAMGLASNKVQ